MPMYNLIEYSDDYSKTSGILFQYCRDVPAVDHNGAVTDLTEANATDTFNLKEKVTDQTGDKGTNNVEIMVPLKYLSKFCSENCVIVANNLAAQATTISIIYVPVVTLSTQDNTKLLEKLKSGFKRTINWNKYQAKVSTAGVNQYFDFLIDPSFQGVNTLFDLPFENEEQRASYKRYYLPTKEIKNDVMINWQNLFDQPIRNNLIT